MICVEYCKHLANGNLIDPPWLENGGYYYNPSNSTYVGFVLPESEREFFVPDDVVELDQAAFMARCIPLSQSMTHDPADKADKTRWEVSDGPAMTAAEIEADVLAFYQNHVTGA